MSKQGQDKIAQMVTDEIVAAMKAGTVPWQQSWSLAGFLPTSMSTGKPYRGVNPWLLMVKASAKGYASPYWGTYDKIAELAGMVKQGNRWVSPDGTPRGVRAGEKSTIVVFHKRILVNDDTAEDGKRAIFMLRYYRVFNAEQADGLPERYFPKPDERTDVERHAAADALIAEYLDNGGPGISKAVGNSPCYAPSLDEIFLPTDAQFKNVDGRYATTFHELTHSTGHKSRLHRDGIDNFDHFGSERYAKEELVAQLGAAMLCAVTGVPVPVDNSAAYLKSWMQALEDDPKLIIQASGQAWKAVDHIQGVTYDNDAD